ncbi:PREDICTED: zinc finger protein 585B-like [Eufriesea mexicana]|uniref:zinc finger protein 585B-like n=1 Tax=Eufriesea mexicana TaxID=516756 RepID=UPI00083BBDD7|nr:PREDICTED: zinc finger protein 585B-like [Eufriesea mexicana]
MRVKTVPRQRVIQGNKNVDPVSETVTGKIENPDQSTSDGDEKETTEDEKDVSHESTECVDAKGSELKDESVKSEKEKEALAYSEEVLDMSIKHKVRRVTALECDSTLFSLITSPTFKYVYSHLKEDRKESICNDDNNNVLPSKTEPESCHSVADSSSKADPESREKKLRDEDKPAEAVNLCKRDCHEEDASNSSVGSNERLKDTFLYKIMTDPKFLENIQKHKQSKRNVCKFCKQEFSNGDELIDHMDVKKDESNQVTCCACKRTFTQKRYLRYHQRCHSERTMFTCNICTKTYTRLDNLSRHNAFHVNPDKFLCTYCEKTFTRKDLLNKHLKCHDNKYRFFCEICKKYFKGPLRLNNHKKNVHLTA